MKKNVQNLSSGKTGHQPVIREIYDCLLDLRGHRGWWPLTELHETGGTNPTKTGSVKGYHPADYTYPQTRGQQFEIICGALLTPVSYTHLRAHETPEHLVCRLLLEKKKKHN